MAQNRLLPGGQKKYHAWLRRHFALLFVLATGAVAFIFAALVLSGMNRNTLMIRHQSEHMVFYCHKGNQAQAREMSPYLEGAYKRAAACLGVSSSGAIDITVHPTRESFDEAMAKAGIAGAKYAFLSRQAVHIAPMEQISAEALESASYQVVRSLLRKLTDRPQNGLLCDATAAYAAKDWRFTDLKNYAQTASSLPFYLFSSTQAFDLYEDFIRLENHQAYELYAIFLAEEGTDSAAAGSLWRIIRARQPLDYARATGYGEDVWQQAWQAWLVSFKPYDLTAYAPRGAP